MKERRCVNHSDRPVHPPSKVLCRECFAELDRKMRGLERQLFGSSESEEGAS